MFVEGKLKELIVLVSENAADSRGLALKLKCLSCDKDVEGDLLCKPPTTRRTSSRFNLHSPRQARRKDEFEKIIG
jgi:hypothetical protein